MKKNVLKKSCVLSVACSLMLGFNTISEAAPDSEKKEVAKESTQVVNTQKETGEASTNSRETKDNQAASNDTAAKLKDVLADPLRPSDTAIINAINKFNGRTVVDLKFEGGSEETRSTAQAAVFTRVGDSLTEELVSNDAASMMQTGYFVDVYPTFEEIPEGVILTYHLQEYPIFRGVRFTGNKIVTTETLEKAVTLKPGERFNSVTFHKNMENVEKAYKDGGYIQARVVDMKRDEGGIIEIKINEGILEGYRVKGNTKTKERVILREMRQKPGEPFNANKARRSYQRVNNLGFFEDVHTRLLPGVEPNSVIMEIEVKEKRTGTFGIGAGYSTADGVLGMVSIGDTNFRGTGDSINIMYEVSGDDRDARGYTFSYRRPWLDKRETAGTIRLYNRTYQYNDYDTDGNLKEEYMRKYSGGELTFSRPMSEYSTNYLTIRNRKDRYIKHITTGNVPDRSGSYGEEWRSKNFGTTRSIIFQHVTDTRDNIYEPETGGRVSLLGEIAGFGGGFNFKKVSIEDTRFRKVGRNQVFATRLAYGVGQGDISEFNQFKVGGQDTLRGYRDDQFRGNRMCLGTLEYRFPLVSRVRGAIFTDWGAAWDNGFRPQNFNGSVGVGLALNTPLGPLRLDYGRGKNGGRVHFTIGGMF